MKAYNSRTYGERIAEVYDDFYPEIERESIDLLHDLANGGRVLELGIGTGRFALPLAEQGLEVVGIDASPAMIEKLRAKPGGDEIRVVEGSFADFPPALDGERFDLIFVVFNTFFALLTQEEQVQCFRSAARHLAENGHFLIEAFAPDLTRFTDGQTVRVVQLSENEVRLEASEVDVAKQQIASHHVVITVDGPRLYPVKLRYAWPSELDLMAKLAGLSLRDRWSSWQKEPFDKKSGKHISVYE